MGYGYGYGYGSSDDEPEEDLDGKGQTMQKGKTAQGSEGTGDSAYDKGASAFDAKANEAKTTDSTPLPESPKVSDVEVLIPGDELISGEGTDREGN